MNRSWGSARTVLAVTAALVLAGCSGAGGDGAFEQAWKQLYPNANMATAKQHAQEVCASFKAGTKYQDELTFLRQQNSQATATDVENMVRVATSSYCPDYKDLH